MPLSQDLRSQHWLRSLQDLVAALPGLVSDRLELLALELHRAGRGIGQIVVLVLVTAILVACAWLALCAGMALALIAVNLSWPLAMLVVLLFNLVLAWAALARVRHLLANLGLPATRRHLVFGADAAAPASLDPPTRPVRPAPEDGR